MALTKEQAETLDAVRRWLDIKAEWEDPEQRDPVTSPDVDHSALLHRLLDGKEPFPEPPPRIHGAAHYPLMEGEVVNVTHVHEEVELAQVVIGGARFDIEAQTDNGYILSHGSSRFEFTYSPEYSIYDGTLSRIVPHNELVQRVESLEEEIKRLNEE